MFYSCGKLTYLDLSSFSTKNVINMRNMFSFCKNLTKLNISSFDTENLNNIRGLFYKCQKKIIIPYKSKFKKFNYNDLMLNNQIILMNSIVLIL